jgi:hypothetical protein
MKSYMIWCNERRRCLLPSTLRQPTATLTAVLVLSMIAATGTTWAQSRRPDGSPPAGALQDLRAKAQSDSARTTAMPKEPLVFLGTLMVAYEGAITGDSRANPELVGAMKNALDRDPEARDVFAMIFKEYKALPVSERERLVGKQLAQATSKTKLSKDLVKQSFFAKPHPLTTTPDLQLDDTMARPKVRPDNRKPTNERQRAEAQNPKELPPGILKRKPDGFVGVQPPQQNSPAYSFWYKGLYCQDEGNDWGSSCEPYVLITMAEGDYVWTFRGGPYEGADSGDQFPRNQRLRNSRPITSPVTVTWVVMENDDWKPEQFQAFVNTAYIVAAAGGKLFNYKLPPSIRETVMDAIRLFKWIFKNDDDHVGTIVEVYTPAQADAICNKNFTWRGFKYDRTLRFAGSSYVFWTFLDIVRTGN